MDSSSEEAVQALLEALGTGDQSRIAEILKKLGVAHQSETHTRVGEMAKNLHQSLLEFQQSMSPEHVTMHSTTLPDAVSKLENVLELTFHAATKTLDSVESQNEILSESYVSLEKALKAITPEHVPDKDLRNELTATLQAERNRVEKSLAINNEIILTQEFQDLTGQTISKVIKLVQCMKNNIQSLVELFAGADGLAIPENLAPDEQSLDSNKLEQDDVDSVLKDCGF